MSEKDQLAEWEALSQEIMVGMRDWRVAHPQASLGEIEAELDQRLARLRARLLQDSALQSQARDWQGAPAEQQPLCPECEVGLEAKGPQRRELQTQGEQQLVLEKQRRPQLQPCLPLPDLPLLPDPNLHLILPLPLHPIVRPPIILGVVRLLVAPAFLPPQKSEPHPTLTLLLTSPGATMPFGCARVIPLQ